MPEAIAMAMGGPLPFLHLRLHLGCLRNDQDLVAVCQFATDGSGHTPACLWPASAQTRLEALAS
jgi:hypothetical protein